MIDRLFTALDNGLKTLTNSFNNNSRNPALTVKEQQLTTDEQQQSIAMMRVNHCGEICAQALYNGQALVAKDAKTYQYLQHCADEETEHLVWCRDRLQQLQAKTSILDPIFYSYSFVIGVISGLLGDKISLGFVSASEDLVAYHLKQHLNRLATNDQKSIAIVEQMLQDELKHRDEATNKGGQPFDERIKSLMRLTSKAMTMTTSKI